MPINVGYLKAKTNKQSDEVYTPAYAIKPLLKYLDNSLTVWCPFDKEDSQYVKIFREYGNKVIFSHIDDGKNFFYYEPEESYDIIISNPPFSIKDDILKKLWELDKPYAMLLPVPALQGQTRFPYIKDDLQYLGFDKRINYYTNQNLTTIQKGISFASCYLCKHFLPKDLIIEELNTEEM